MRGPARIEFRSASSGEDDAAYSQPVADALQPILGLLRREFKHVVRLLRRYLLLADLAWEHLKQLKWDNRLGIELCANPISSVDA